MKKKVLSEKFIVKGKLPKESLVDNVLLRAHILEADEEYKDKTEINNIPLTDSIPVKHHKHIFWVFDYVRDMFNLKNFSTTSIFNYFGILILKIQKILQSLHYYIVFKVILILI